MGAATDPRAEELDEHFRASVIVPMGGGDADLYVNDYGEDAEAIADSIGGVEYAGTNGKGFYFNLVEEEPSFEEYLEEEHDARLHTSLWKTETPRNAEVERLTASFLGGADFNALRDDDAVEISYARRGEDETTEFVAIGLKDGR